MRMIIKLVLACTALIINLTLLGLVIWQAKKKPGEVMFWPMITALIVAVASAAVQAAL